ncbi:S1 RNA-binding domain-containing protein [Patescibacteria group bacterium]|nr:S1 RNA-binding domain-containing protein [Patescibacteria group bacterium]MBU2633241.1 S1 RNA-binding domain-containing protein [Patescibacteria group bacterium]
MLATAEKDHINIKKTNTSMDFLARILPLNPPKEGELVEGRVLQKRGAILFIDINPFGTGIIYGREFNNAREIIRSLKPGDIVTAKITESENEDGYIELSLKEAGEEIVWREAEEAQKKQEVFSLPVIDANKGGLIFDWNGLQGFLPASQLKTSHYPRVEGGDKDKILDELKKLISKKFTVTIIGADQKDSKLIFSEKETGTNELKNIISKYRIGDTIEGEVTGIVEFGIFIKMEEGLEGLAHISELDWGLVENPSKLFEVGNKVNAQIIGIKDDRISLSVKALKFNPWESAKNKYKKDDIVKGVVIKFNKYGTLVSIEEGVAGLAHISEFESEEEMKKKLELGKSYNFKISLFEPEKQRLILTYLE